MTTRIAFQIATLSILALVLAACANNGAPSNATPSSTTPSNAAPDTTRLQPIQAPAVSRPMGGRGGG